MTLYVNLEKWRGRRDDVALDPTAIEFAAIRRSSCAGCAFECQWSEVCTKALQEAVKRSLPRCEDGFVYRLVEQDARQLSIEGA